jgi:hypothetical protein
MNTTTSRGLVRFVAGPVAVAGIIGGALGLAAVANASTAPTFTHGTAAMGQVQNSHAASNPDSSPTNAGGLMQATNAGGLMQATNAGGLMQATASTVG